MKKLILIIILLLLMGGCGNPYPGESVQPYDKNLGRFSNFHDDDLKVTCWTFKDGSYGGLSCIPDWMLKPPDDKYTLIEGCVIKVEHIEGLGNVIVTLRNGIWKFVAIPPKVGDYIGLMCNSASNYCPKVDYIRPQPCG